MASVYSPGVNEPGIHIRTWRDALYWGSIFAVAGVFGLVGVLLFVLPVILYVVSIFLPR